MGERCLSMGSSTLLIPNKTPNQDRCFFVKIFREGDDNFMAELIIEKKDERKIEKEILQDFKREYALNQRELEVLQGWIAGKNNGQLAESLYLTRQAITYHSQNLLQKMGIENRHQIIVKIMEWLEERYFKKKGRFF